MSRTQSTRAAFPLRFARAYPRFLVAVAVAVVFGLFAPSQWAIATRLLVAWNIGAIVLSAAIVMLMARADDTKMRSLAQRQDVNPVFILLIIAFATFASVGAIFAQLAASKDAVGWAKAAHVALAIGTIVSGWLATHLLFTMHYAHEYYGAGLDGHRGGLDFPDEKRPTYSDFVYFSFVIAVASQTADVAITSRAMRRLAVAHGVFAFFYNLAILGLTVNIGASLI